MTVLYGMISQFAVVDQTKRIFQLPLEIMITSYVSVCIVQKIYRKNYICCLIKINPVSLDL
jgi:hypothetical protein